MAGEKVEFNERGYRDIDKKRTRKVTKTFLENNNIPIWFMPMIGFGFDDEGNLVKQKVNSDGEITVSEISELLTAINTLLNSQDADNNLNVKHTGSNAELLAPETLTWNGTETEKETADIDVPDGKTIAVRIDNGADQQLTVTFEHKNGSDYIDYYGADGIELYFSIPANTHRVFAPIQAFPRFDGGRIVVTADSAPTADDETTIEVQEV